VIARMRRGSIQSGRCAAIHERVPVAAEAAVIAQPTHMPGS